VVAVRLAARVSDEKHIRGIGHEMCYTNCHLYLYLYHYVHFGMTVIKVFYFIPNNHKSNSNSDRLSLYDFVVL